MSNPKFMNVHEDEKLVNENCVVKLPNVRFYSVRMNPLLVQIFNTKGKINKTNNSTDCKTRIRFQ